MIVETRTVLESQKKFYFFLKNFQHAGLFHSLALVLVAMIPAYEKFLAKEIFSHVIFNPDFFR